MHSNCIYKTESFNQDCLQSCYILYFRYFGATFAYTCSLPLKLNSRTATTALLAATVIIDHVWPGNFHTYCIQHQGFLFFLLIYYTVDFQLVMMDRRNRPETWDMNVPGDNMMGSQYLLIDACSKGRVLSCLLSVTSLHCCITGLYLSLRLCR